MMPADSRLCQTLHADRTGHRQLSVEDLTRASRQGDRQVRRDQLSARSASSAGPLINTRSLPVTTPPALIRRPTIRDSR